MVDSKQHRSVQEGVETPSPKPRRRKLVGKPDGRRKLDWRLELGLDPSFPLFRHKNGYWCKKVRRKFAFFTKVADDARGEAALNQWEEQRADLLAGRKPRPKVEGVTLRDVCNAFLAAKRELLLNGEITPRTYDDYRATTDTLIDHFGKLRVVVDLGPDDFAAMRSKLAKRLGVVALGNAIQRIRSVFKHAVENGLIDRMPLYGSGFKRPSKKSLRLNRAAKGPRLFTPEELQTLIDNAPANLKAAILLGINGGLSNGDIAALPIDALDLQGGWLNFARVKTGIERRIPLWDTTVKAIQRVLAKRRKPKDPADANLVFITKHGHAWSKLGRYAIEDTAPRKPEEQDQDEEKKRKWVSGNNALSKEFKKLASKHGIDRSYYDLRHTFQTIGGESLDAVAVGHIMGHADESMSAVYRERISDERLRKVVDHVKAWVFAATKKKAKLRVVG